MDSKCFPNNFFPIIFFFVCQVLRTCQNDRCEYIFYANKYIKFGIDMVESNVFTSFLFNYSKKPHT